MKGGICILKKMTSKTFDFSNEFHTRELLESMNEKWKSQVIISFSIYSKIKMNGFIDWHLWIKNLFSYEVNNKYNGLIEDQNRHANTDYFLFIIFQRIQQIKCKKNYVKIKRYV